MGERTETAGTKKKEKVDGLGKFDECLRNGEDIAKATIGRRCLSIKMGEQMREENFEEEIEKTSKKGEGCFGEGCEMKIVKGRAGSWSVDKESVGVEEEADEGFENWDVRNCEGGRKMAEDGLGRGCEKVDEFFVEAMGVELAYALRRGREHGRGNGEQIEFRWRRMGSESRQAECRRLKFLFHSGFAGIQNVI